MLRERARRILASEDDKFEPSPPPALIDAITDELLVVASDTVAAAATEAQTKPSGKAKYRLLAWLVADARGADTPLDKALAETVGKRLDRQAAAVRTAIAHNSAACRIGTRGRPVCCCFRRDAAGNAAGDTRRH